MTERQLRESILRVLGRDEMKSIVVKRGLPGADLRSRESMSQQILLSADCDSAFLLEYLSELQVKMVCAEVGLSQVGRRFALIERLKELLGNPAQADSATSKPGITDAETDDEGGPGVEAEDTGADDVSEPFQPKDIRIEFRQLTIDLLIKRLKGKAINLETTFQRKGGLWNEGAQSRLIESLMIRFPLPAFYFDATDEDRWLVVDGLQRLTSLRRFAVDEEFALCELEFLKQYSTGTYTFSRLPPAMQRRIEEMQVPAYMIMPGTPEGVKFNLFKRINTGGLPLSAQEIRHALNQGPAARLLQRLAEHEDFLRATDYGIKDDRMADRECVLRFFAFLLMPHSKYRSGDLDGFLHEQMRTLNQVTEREREQYADRFLRSMRAAYRLFDQDAFRKRYAPKGKRRPINKALFESWSVALALREDAEIDLLVARRGKLRTAFIELMGDREFDLAVSQGTGSAARVRLRFQSIQQIIEETLS